MPLFAAPAVATWAGTICAGCSVALLVRLVMSLYARVDASEAPRWDYDQVRLATLRQGSRLMCWCEPFIRGIEATLPYWPVLSCKEVSKAIQRDLNRGGCHLPFKASEFLAICVFQAVCACLVCLPLALAFMQVGNALAITMLISAVVATLPVRELANSSQQRLESMKQQLPFCIDLLALMINAGEEFLPSLNTLVDQTKGSLIGDEFARVLRNTEANLTLASSFQDLADRMADIEISEMTTAIIRGHEQGTPPNEIFVCLADEFRLRRTQWAEKRSGQLQTMITFPCFIVMCASLLAVLTPFLLALKESPF